MKNNIDKLFKSNTEKGSFPFEESSWVAAESLLKSKKSGGGFAKGLILGTAIITIAAVALFGSIESEKTTIDEQTSITNSTKIDDNQTPLLPIKPTQTNTLKTSTPDNSITNIQTTNQQQTFSKTQDPILIESSIEELTIEKPEPTNTKAGTNELAAPKVIPANKVTANNQPTSSLQADKTEPVAAAEDHAVFDEQTPTIFEGETKETEPEPLAMAEPEVNDQPEPEIAPEIAAETSEEYIEPFKWTDNLTYSFGADYGYYFIDRSLQPSNPYSIFRNAFEQSSNLQNYGLSLQVGFKNWTLNSGIYRTTIQEKITYPTTTKENLGVDESHWDVLEYWTYAVDSNWVIDSIYTGHWGYDTTYTYNVDSSYITRWDTVQVDKENPELAKNNGIKTMSYVEVPLLFGRSFKLNRVVIDLQGGVAFGFLTGVTGSQYINKTMSSLSGNNVEQFNKVLYNAVLRTGVRFALSQNMEVGIYPTIRYTLNSVIREDITRQRYFGYGLQIGLSYRL